MITKVTWILATSITNVKTPTPIWDATWAWMSQGDDLRINMIGMIIAVLLLIYEALGGTL
jgi:hypothetical protein